MLYVLGHKATHFSVQVETHVWFRGGWQLQLHKVNALQPAKLTVGGQSLPVGDEVYSVVLQNVSGWEGTDVIRHGAADRTHITAESSEYPILKCNVDGEATLICLAYCGRETPTPWEDGITR